MNSLQTIYNAFVVTALVLFASSACHAEIKIANGHSETNAGFTFPGIPSPANNDAATNAQFQLIDGQRDRNGGDVAVLHDGRVPGSDDQPAQNFFFRSGTAGGRIRIDLGRVVSIKQVSSYSWHDGSRGPQVYTLYAADGTAESFNAEPKTGTDPARTGWKQVAAIDTRPKDGDGAGQHGVTISDSVGIVGQFRYLLFDIARTEDRDNFGNTFYSEFDVIDADAPAPTSIVQKPILKSFETDDGKFQFIVDATDAPDLMEWTEKKLKPVVSEWYPKVVALLPSEVYQAPTKVTFRYRSDMGGTPASALGAGVNLSTPWFRRERDGEACGAVVHELVHVVQNYWARRGQPRARTTPGWIVEGIADYVRWFLYEPQSRGAEITKKNFAEAKYDSSYRVTANFLNWVTVTYDKEIVRKLNAAAREGRYDESLWTDLTGKTVQELGSEWKKLHEERLKPQ